MAKLTTITDRETGEPRYPITSTRAVFDERGVDLETLMTEQKRETVNTLKGYARATELTEGLAGKQNRLSTTTDLHITDDNIIGLTDSAKIRLFTDLWNAACGTYGRYDPNNAPDAEHPFLLNELWLTYEQAVAVMNTYHKGVNHGEALSHFPVRTNIPVSTQWSCDLSRYAQSNTSVEVLNLPVSLFGNNLLQAFYGCTRLRKVYGISHLNAAIDSYAFGNCKALEYVGISRLKSDIDLHWSPLLGLDSLQFIITNAANTSAITITVHPDVYAKLTDETNEEWHKVLTDAAEKNILFSTI